MSALPVIFEDHTAAGFRPLSWSVPVFELRCGLFNLRERVSAVCATEPVLLPRSYLADLTRASVGGAQLAGDDRPLLLLSARLGADWTLLEDLGRRCRETTGWWWGDQRGLLAACVAGDAGRQFLAAWRAWDAAAEASGCWRRPDVPPPGFLAPSPAMAVAPRGEPWTYLWDLVTATGPALGADTERALRGELPARRLWGILPSQPGQPPWSRGTALHAASWPGTHLVAAGRVLAGDGVEVAPGVVIDASAGPVVLDRDVRVNPHCVLEGPLYLGAGTVVKAGARIAGETSIGAGCKIAGEIGESTFLDYVNKQHDGFIGHAYLGSWVNLGAMTTCSDLKNNYGRIRVDAGAGELDTGLRFLGLLAGEHTKTAIGTLFNTATTVGFASNVFAVGFPPKYLGNFTWGDGRDAARQEVAKALATAAVVMQRRGCELQAEHAALFQYLAG